MTNKLFDKIMLLVDDIDSLDRYGKGRTIERFIKAEMGLAEEAKHLDEVDVNSVLSRAAQMLQDTPMARQADPDSYAGNPSFFRTVCYVRATVEILRSKGLLSHPIGYRRNKRPYTP